MSRLILCGGLVLDAVAGVLSIPGISESASSTAWLAGGALTLLPPAYKFVAATFAVMLTEAPEMPELKRLPLFNG